jgi:hypothetical protein
MIDADKFPQEDFELIHRYIRKRLDPKNKKMVIRSVNIDCSAVHELRCVGHFCDAEGIPLNTKMEKLIYGIGDRL